MSEHIGQVIKRYREERKLSKSRLARESDVSDAYLVQIEKGDRTPSREVLERFAAAMRVPPHWLLIPAGVYSPEAVASAERMAADYVEMCEHRGKQPSEDVRDRIIYESLVEGERPVEDYELEPVHPYEIPAGKFYGWDRDQAWAPEGWQELTDQDRKLVQQLINRLRFKDVQAD